MSLSKWLPCDFEQCHPLLWGGGILVDHWSTISSFDLGTSHPGVECRIRKLIYQVVVSCHCVHFIPLLVIVVSQFSIVKVLASMQGTLSSLHVCLRIAWCTIHCEIRAQRHEAWYQWNLKSTVLNLYVYGACTMPPPPFGSADALKPLCSNMLDSRDAPQFFLGH